jgi:hypothetical protein
VGGGVGLDQEVGAPVDTKFSPVDTNLSRIALITRKVAEFAQNCGAHGWLVWHIRAGPWMASHFAHVARLGDDMLSDSVTKLSSQQACSTYLSSPPA